MGGKIYFSSSYQIFQSTVLVSIDSGPVVRQNIMVAGVCGGEGCSPHGGQEAEGKKGIWGPVITFKGIPPSYPLLPAKPRLPKFPLLPKVAPPIGDQVFNT
jgi:hypothetical protein